MGMWWLKVIQTSNFTFMYSVHVVETTGFADVKFDV